MNSYFMYNMINGNDKHLEILRGFPSLLGSSSQTGVKMAGVTCSLSPNWKYQ